MKHKTYLALALPLVVATLTQPLLGAVDTAVVGQLNKPEYIGGVAIGAIIFNTLYWLFGFLRVSTSGFTAQADGLGDEQALELAYLRPCIIAVAIGIGLIGLMPLIEWGVISLYHSEKESLHFAIQYFKILIWGAPFVMLGYVNLGWLMGKGLIKETLWLQISANLVNVVLDFIFVKGFNWAVLGVSYATLIAQIYSFLLGLYWIKRHMPLVFSEKNIKKASRLKELGALMRVNSDLMMRTICLLIMTNLFMASSASLGKETLAANAILYQMQYVISYLFDGFSNASSILAGRSKGLQDKVLFKRVIYFSSYYAGVVALGCAAGLIAFGKWFIELFTSAPSVQLICQTHLFWLILFALVIGPGMTYYGIFSGVTQLKPVRNTMLIALIVFVITLYLSQNRLGNHGIWLAFILFSLTRSITLMNEMKKGGELL